MIYTFKSRVLQNAHHTSYNLKSYDTAADLGGQHINCPDLGMTLSGWRADNTIISADNIMTLSGWPADNIMALSGWPADNIMTLSGWPADNIMTLSGWPADNIMTLSGWPADNIMTVSGWPADNIMTLSGGQQRGDRGRARDSERGGGDMDRARDSDSAEEIGTGRGRGSKMREEGMRKHRE